MKSKSDVHFSWFGRYLESVEKYFEVSPYYDKTCFLCPNFIQTYLMHVLAENLAVDEIREIFGHDIELIYRLNLDKEFESLIALKANYDVLRTFLDEQKEKDHQISAGQRKDRE